MIIPQNIIDLVNIAINDKNISPREREFIVEAAKKEGISEKTINEYIDTALENHLQSQQKDNLIYCKHCGTLVIPTDGDCPYCGNNLIPHSQKTQKETTSNPNVSSSWKERYEISHSNRISPKIVLLIVTAVITISFKFIKAINKKEIKNKATYTTTTKETYSASSLFNYRYSTGAYYDELSLTPAQPIATLQPLSNETAELIRVNRIVGDRKKTLNVYLLESKKPKLEIEIYPLNERKSKAGTYRLTITDTYGNAIEGLPYFDFKAHYEDNMIVMTTSTDFFAEDTEEI